MSFRKRWVPNRLRRLSGDGRHNEGSGRSLDGPPSPPETLPPAREPNVREEDGSFSGGHSIGLGLDSPDGPKKSWEYHYGSYLSRKGGDGAPSLPKLNRNLMVMEEDEDDLPANSLRCPSSDPMRVANSRIIPAPSVLPRAQTRDAPKHLPSMSHRSPPQQQKNGVFSTPSPRSDQSATPAAGNANHSRIRRNTKSYDSLDMTIRRGHDATYSKSNPHYKQHQERIDNTRFSSPRILDESTHRPSSLHAISSARLLSNKNVNDTSKDPLDEKNSSSIRAKKSKEMKKIFTEFHNSSIYSKDSRSPYLGDDTSGHQAAYIALFGGPAPKVKGNAINRPSRRQQLSSSFPLALVDDAAVSKNSRVLIPLEGPEEWRKDQKYLIAPAVLSLCPIQVLSWFSGAGDANDRNTFINDDCVDGSVLEEKKEKEEKSLSSFIPPPPLALAPPQASPFAKVVLGTALVTQVRKRNVSDESNLWCKCMLVIRQNYLLEYDVGVSLDSKPRGYAHLENSVVFPHKEFGNVLQLNFFSNPCSEEKETTNLSILVSSGEERDHWVSALMKAACLRIRDLYDYDDSDGGLEFGRGRYATVRPAKRRDGQLRAALSDVWPSQSHGANFVSPEPPCRMYTTPYTGNGLASFGSDWNDEPSFEYNCALKIVDKTEFWAQVQRGKERVDTLVRETAVQATLTAIQGNNSHKVPTFLRLHNFFETRDKVVLELELLSGIDLFCHVSSKGVLGENEAAHILRDILLCVDGMHRIGVAHRDVKPSNILMCNPSNKDGIAVKLGDFGMSAFAGVDNLLRGRCGTPGYVAPEILLSSANKGYENKVDIFSAGVTLYVLLCGYEPFYGESDAELIEANKRAKVEFPQSDWREVSVEGRDLIEKMLQANPKNRISAADALRHPWITRRAPPHLRKENEGNNSITSFAQKDSFVS